LSDKKLRKELIRLLSVEGQPTKAVLAQTCMGVFFIRYVSDTIFSINLLPKPPAVRRLHFSLDKRMFRFALAMYEEVITAVVIVS
jgi:hypothetical protein